MKRILFSTLAILGSLVLRSQAALVNFDNTNDLANSFKLNAGAPILPVNIATGGLGNSGSVVPSQGNTDEGTEVLTNTTPFSFSQAGNQVHVSMYFKEQTPTTANTPALQLGIVPDANGRLDFGSPESGVTVALTPGLANNDSAYLLQFRDLSSFQNTTEASGIQLVPGHWYQMDTMFVNVGGGNISASATIYNSDSVGTIGSTVPFASFTATTFSFNLAGQSTVLPAFRGFGDLGGASNYDNFFAAIPEPSSLLLFAASGVLLRRKRQN